MQHNFSPQLSCGTVMLATQHQLCFLHPTFTASTAELRGLPANQDVLHPPLTLHIHTDPKSSALKHLGERPSLGAGGKQGAAAVHLSTASAEVPAPV